jgi:hypothetical protein
MYGSVVTRLVGISIVGTIEGSLLVAFVGW